MKYPIYIPSKGRFEKNPTATMLMFEGIKFYLVVEPQDAKEYQYRFQDVLVMPENNRGISYVRNFAKNHSIKNGHTHHWQIDDNIKSLMIRENGKNVRSRALGILEKVEFAMSKFSNIGGCGLKHHIFAFGATNPVDINKQIYSCILVNNKVPCFWEEDIVEDTDFSLQILNAGYCTLLFNRLLIEKMTTGSMKGGNTEISYAADGRAVRSLGLQSKYPGYFKVTTQHGRIKISPSRIWNTFKQRPKRCL